MSSKPPSNLPCSGPQVVKLKKFTKFENTAEALAASAALVDSKLGSSKMMYNYPISLYFIRTTDLFGFYGDHVEHVLRGWRTSAFTSVKI